MPWSIFRRVRGGSPHSSRQQADGAWWQQAELVAADASVDAVRALRVTLAGAADQTDAPDEADRQTEFIEGLERVLELRQATALPAIPTQHRVIGGDPCHFIAPVSLVGPAAVAGKLFLTSHRAIFTGAAVVSWPWHRVRSAVREDRDVILTILGGADPCIVRCNTYADAFEAAFLADALIQAARRPGSGA